MIETDEFYKRATYTGPPLADGSDNTPEPPQTGNAPTPATPAQIDALHRWLANRSPRQGRQYRQAKPDVVTNLLRTQRRKEAARRKEKML